MQVRIDIIQGDCGQVLRQFDSGAFDLIVTWPPYAARRTNTYGGTKPSLYVV